MEIQDEVFGFRVGIEAGFCTQEFFDGRGELLGHKAAQVGNVLRGRVRVLFGVVVAAFGDVVGHFEARTTEFGEAVVDAVARCTQVAPDWKVGGAKQFGIALELKIPYGLACYL